MKSPSRNGLLCCAILLASLCVSAQEQHSFNAVIPNLQLLESGFPAIKNIDATGYCRFEKIAKEDKSFKFVGNVITTDMLKDKLGVIKQRNNPVLKPIVPAVKKLAIFCDSLVLNDTLWLPQCDFDIRARVINMKGHPIISSPVAWEKAIKPASVEEKDEENGRDGLNAGNINIVCDKILNEGALAANGTGGEWIYAPKVSINWPVVTTHIECYKNMGCSNQGNGRSIGVDKGKNWKYNMVATVFRNEDHALFSHDVCWGYKSWDPGGVEFSSKNDFNSTITDKKENERIVAAKYKPGKGGNAGKITVVCGDRAPRTMIANGGDCGYFRPRRSEKSFTYSADRDKCTYINFESESYYLYDFKVRSSSVGDMEVNLSWSYRDGNNIRVPSYNAINNFNSGLSFYNPNAKGASYSPDARLARYTPHPEYFLMRMKYISEQYAIYHKKSLAEQQALDNETNELADNLKKIVETPGIDPTLKPDYLTACYKAIELSQRAIKNTDDYNNPPGYRPILSITSTMSYIKDNLKSDLRLYVLSDIMADNEQKAGEFKSKIPEMIEGLCTANKTLSEELAVVNKKYEGLAGEAAECARKTDTIKEKLKQLEARLREQAKSDQQKMALMKAGIQTLALAASVIPYGQPALGQIAGNALNAVADNLEDPSNITVSVMEKIDMSGAMKMLAKQRLSDLKPKKDKTEDYKLNAADSLALGGHGVYEYNKKIKDAKNKKAVDDYEEALTKKKETFTKVASGTQKILAGYAKNSVNKDEIEKRLAALANSNYLYQDIQYELQAQLDLKEKIFGELGELVQESGAINAQLLQNSDDITKLQEQYMGGIDYNKGLEEVMHDVRDASLARLKWVEYQLVKVYEYTMLTPYALKMPSSEVLDELYKREKKKASPNDVDAIVEKLAIAYKGQQAEMGNAIFKNISTGHRQDKKEMAGGRKIILTKDADAAIARLLEELNSDNHEVTMDLQKDLVDNVIKPGESETRIIDISLDKIEFEGGATLPENLSVDVSLDVEDGGVLRKGDHFYYFQAGQNSGEQAPDRWKWTVHNTNGSNAIANESELSDQYKDLISFMTSSGSSTGRDDKKSLFTLPPAWSRCKVKLQFNGSAAVSGASLPKVAKLVFSMRCDYVDMANNHKKVLDIKLPGAPAGMLYKTTVNNVTREHNTNFYSIVPTATEVTVELNEPKNTDPAKKSPKFIKWSVMGGTVADKNDLQNKKLRVKVSNDTRIVAVFGE